MRMQLERNGRTVWADFPCADGELVSMMEKLGAVDPLDTKVRVTAMETGFEMLAPLLRKTHSMDHLNLLGRYMDSFFGSEFTQYMAAVSYTGVENLKDFINLTQNIANYTLVQPKDSLKTIGLCHYINLHGSYPVSGNEEEAELNLAAIGQELLATGKGVKTPYGLVFENGKEMWEPFNGTNIPCFYDRDFVFSCRLSYNGAEEYLFLPCHEVSIAKAVHRLGAGDLSECSLDIEDYMPVSWEELMDVVKSPATDLYELNRFAQASETFGDADIHKLCAMRKYIAEKESVDGIPMLTVLADHLGCFQFAPKVGTAEELGEFLIKESNEYSFDPVLEDYYDYGRFGEDIMEEQNGMFLDAGYIGVCSDRELWEILEPNEEQQMGGMT